MIHSCTELTHIKKFYKVVLLFILNFDAVKCQDDKNKKDQQFCRD